MWQPRFGVAWDVRGNGRSLVRASYGVYYARQNMLSQVGFGHDQRSAAADDLREYREPLDFGAPTPTWPGVVTPTPLPEGQFPLFSGVRVFDRDYKNPHIFAFNVAYEHQLGQYWAAYADFIWNEGHDLTRFLNYNRSGPVCCVRRSRHRELLRLHGNALGTAARRGDGDQQPRLVDLPRADLGAEETDVERLPARRQLRVVEG